MGVMDGRVYSISKLRQMVLLRNLLHGRRQRLALMDSVAILSQVSAGLEHFQSAGLHHGSVDPWSVYVTADESGALCAVLNEPQVILAQLQREGFYDAAHWKDRAPFVAPEALEGSNGRTPGADLFGLGAIAFLLASGEALPALGPRRFLQNRDSVFLAEIRRRLEELGLPDEFVQFTLSAVHPRSRERLGDVRQARQSLDTLMPQIRGYRDPSPTLDFFRAIGEGKQGPTINSQKTIIEESKRAESVDDKRESAGPGEIEEVERSAALTMLSDELDSDTVVSEVAEDGATPAAVEAGHEHDTIRTPAVHVGRAEFEPDDLQGRTTAVPGIPAAFTGAPAPSSDRSLGLVVRIEGPAGSFVQDLPDVGEVHIGTSQDNDIVLPDTPALQDRRFAVLRRVTILSLTAETTFTLESDASVSSAADLDLDSPVLLDPESQLRLLVEQRPQTPPEAKSARAAKDSGDLEQRATNAEGRVDALTKEKDRLEDDLADRKGKEQRLSAEAKSASTRALEAESRLQGAQQAWATQRDELNKRLKSKDAKLRELEQANADSEEQFRAATSDTDRAENALAAQRSETTARLDEIAERLNALSGEKREIAQKLRETEASRDELSDTVDQLRIEIARLKG